VQAAWRHAVRLCSPGQPTVAGRGGRRRHLAAVSLAARPTRDVAAERHPHRGHLEAGGVQMEQQHVVASLAVVQQLRGRAGRKARRLSLTARALLIGEETVSEWSQACRRIVLCAPGRPRLGPLDSVRRRRHPIVSIRQAARVAHNLLPAEYDAPAMQARAGSRLPGAAWRGLQRRRPAP
jgi:hypothetical protein